MGWTFDRTVRKNKRKKHKRCTMKQKIGSTQDTQDMSEKYCNRKATTKTWARQMWGAKWVLIKSRRRREREVTVVQKIKKNATWTEGNKGGISRATIEFIGRRAVRVEKRKEEGVNLIASSRCNKMKEQTNKTMGLTHLVLRLCKSRVLE